MDELENKEIPFETLEIHSYDFTVRDGFGDNDHVAIHCWALDKHSKPVLARFVDFPAFCHMELPQFIHNKRYLWNKTAADRFMDHLGRILGDDGPYSYQFKMAEKTYYYRNGRRFPMVLMSFNSLKAMRHCSNILENPLKTNDWGMIHCRVWEDSIGIVRKFLTVRDVRYCQWFRVQGQRVEPELRVSTLEREYICSWDTMEKIPHEECKTWNTQPGVLAFDIECYSNNHRAMPDKYNALHVAYMISAIYQRYRDPTTRVRYAIIIGDCNHIPTERLENCTIVKVKDEIEMVTAFGKVVTDTDPEIITGYNILSFDYPYLDHRIKRRLCDWPAMGRIIGEFSQMDSKTWHSSAYGHQTINILKMEGRISIDLLPLVKRDYKLEKYDLNSVCAKFLNKTKHDVKATEMFLIYEDMRNTLTALVKLSQEAQENRLLLNDLTYITQKAEAQAAFHKAKEETTKVLEYCIRDSELVIELMESLNVWVGLIEMANIVGVTIVELFTRGQQVRCVSQLYDLAAKLGYILDKRDTPGFKFKGGFVFEPIPGLYDNIICLDFASLYPSIMMAYNICYTTLVPPELENDVPDEDCHIIEFDQDELENDDGTDDEDEDAEVFEELTAKPKREKLVQKHYRFKFYKKREGLLPRLVRDLVTERRAVNSQIVQVKDELKANEKLEEIRVVLGEYLSGRLTIGTVKELVERVKQLCESKPPAAPEVITAAKRQLSAAQLFDVTVATKKYEDAKVAKPPMHPTALRVAKLEYQIACNYAGEKTELLHEQLTVLQQNHTDVATLVANLKLLIVVLDKRQLAIKVSANSFFGFLGVHNGGKMPLIEGAMSITAKGRELIGLVRKYIEEKYQGVQIYGDTDSIMVDLPGIKNSKECNYWGLRLSQEISGIKPGEKDCDGVFWPEGRRGLFLSPLSIEFEKAMLLLCLKKKKYAAYLVAKDGTFKTEEVKDKHGNVIDNRLIMLKKGIVLARRDNCPILRELYTKILELIMNKGKLDEAINMLVDTVQLLLSGNVPPTKLVTIRELGANYKSDSYFMKVFSEQLKKAGKIVNPGDRLDFVIVEDPNATLLGHKMRLLEQYNERLTGPNPEKIDYNYYIEKSLMNPINQLFEVGFKDIISKLPHVMFRPTNRHKPIHLDEPVKIILRMRERGFDINEFKKAVKFNLDKLQHDSLGLPPVKQLVLKIAGANTIVVPPLIGPTTPAIVPVPATLAPVQAIVQPPVPAPIQTVLRIAPRVQQMLPVQQPMLPPPRVMPTIRPPTSPLSPLAARNTTGGTNGMPPPLILPRIGKSAPPSPAPQIPSVQQIPQVITQQIPQVPQRRLVLNVQK